MADGPANVSSIGVIRLWDKDRYILECWIEMLFLAPLPWTDVTPTSWTDAEDAQMFSFQILGGFPQTNRDSCLSLTGSLERRREVCFHAHRYCFSQNSAKDTVFSKE